MKPILFSILIFLLNNLSAQETTSQKIQQCVNQAVDHKFIKGSTLAVSYKDSSWYAAAGNLKKESTYFIASTTKIYITAIILNLEQQGKLSTKDLITKYLDKAIMNNLLVYDGVDYSAQITIEQLLSHTSGIPDYFEDKNENGQSLLEDLTAGNDQSWTYSESIARSKKMKPRFSPGEKDYAHYSDTNFQLLDLIIEKITGKKVSTVMEEMIFQPLGLKETWLYVDPADTRPADLNYKKEKLVIPNAMASFRGDGGIVSTTKESMIFLKAFFNGTFFPKEKLQTMYTWKKVMFPLEYGMGVMRFKLPKSMTGGKKYPELIGHSGLSGAFAYYCPEKDLYLAGTVNQIHKPASSYKLVLKIMDLFE